MGAVVLVLVVIVVVFVAGYLAGKRKAGDPYGRGGREPRRYPSDAEWGGAALGENLDPPR